ncbi:hypothetical protein BS78_10G169000 [Paspalum vaginatum]|nr:hypothetical protein BS78_10G169000 [Paspalum vaginatum]
MDGTDFCLQQQKPIRKNIIEASTNWFHLDVCYIWPANFIRIIPSWQPSGVRSTGRQGRKHGC